MIRFRDGRVTNPDEGDLLSVEIPVDRISAYEAAATVLPARMWAPTDVIEAQLSTPVQVFVGGEWIDL